jgi:hypothetical protein
MKPMKLDELSHSAFVDTIDISIVELIDKRISQIQMTLMHNEGNSGRLNRLNPID